MLPRLRLPPRLIATSVAILFLARPAFA